MSEIRNGMRPIHPGEILREEFLVPLNLSANALAIALGVPAPRINDVARERRGITADTALRLARYFGTSAEFWRPVRQAGADCLHRRSVGDETRGEPTQGQVGYRCTGKDQAGGGSECLKPPGCRSRSRRT